MAKNYGKIWEQRFREDMLKLANISVDRLPDQFTGLKNSSNISDFIVYKYPSLIFAEVKCCYGNTFNFANLRQYDKLLAKKDIKGVFPYVIIWFIDHDKVLAFNIKDIELMKKDKLKSINIKTYDNYNHIDIPVQKKRVLVTCDYSEFFNQLER